MVHIHTLHETLQKMVQSKQDIEGNVNAFIYHYTTFSTCTVVRTMQKHYHEFF